MKSEQRKGLFLNAMGDTGDGAPLQDGTRPVQQASLTPMNPVQGDHLSDLAPIS